VLEYCRNFGPWLYFFLAEAAHQKEEVKKTKNQIATDFFHFGLIL
jgi:hypothetical protein